MKILLVEPEFPIANKSKNHQHFLPIGLLKLNDYYSSIGNKTKIVRGNLSKLKIGTRYIPDKIFITTLFTYWSEYVWVTVKHYRVLFPKAEIVLGGIYASLHSDNPEFIEKLNECKAKVFIGLHPEAEDYASKNCLNYSILQTKNNGSIDYQILHTSRGCFRKCSFCGTWKIEPAISSKKSILKEICSRKLIFYDNNLLANPNIEGILQEIINERLKRNFLTCESQSGFDGRILLKKPYLAKMLKQAGFINPRIAWDNGYSDKDNIKKQIEILVNAGYISREIFVFILYNYNMSFLDIEKKRVQCWNWKVQINDCRYRPLTQTFDNYEPYKFDQTNSDYYIHNGWEDSQIKQFRRNIRRQNICIRQKIPFYSRNLERMKVSAEESLRLRALPRNKLIKEIPDIWFPL
jgi:hypothetical protein